jgi:AraC-like DNA-binding protein
MQKKTKTEFSLENERFGRFCSSLQSMIDDRIIDGQIVQYSPGGGVDQVMGCKSDRVGLVHIRFPHEACVRTAQPKNLVTFSLPLTRADTWTVNGVTGGQRTLFVNFGTDETHIFAPRRNLIAGGVETRFLLETLAALRGFEPDETDIPKGAFSLDPRTYEHLAKVLLRAIYASNLFEDVVAVDQSVVSALAEALLTAPSSRTTPQRRASEIFSIAQRHLLKQPLIAVSVEDLCRICGVSAPTLTRSFYQMTGRTPMRYSRMVRLSMAHNLLSDAASDLKTVKEIASLSGFPELGRFSELYRRTYGALPSIVLEKRGLW